MDKTYTITYNVKRLVRTGERGGEVMSEVPRTEIVPNCYKVLGVSQDATLEQIKSQFRQLSRQFHPDKAEETMSVDQQAQVNVAYAVLSDPVKRKSLDNQMAGRSPSRYDFTTPGTNTQPTQPQPESARQTDKSATFKKYWDDIQYTATQLGLPSVRDIRALNIDSAEKQRLVAHLLTRREYLFGNDVKFSAQQAFVPSPKELQILLDSGEITREIHARLLDAIQQRNQKLLETDISFTAMEEGLMRSDDLDPLVKEQKLTETQLKLLKTALRQRRFYLIDQDIRLSVSPEAIPSIPKMRERVGRGVLTQQDCDALIQQAQIRAFTLLQRDIEMSWSKESIISDIRLQTYQREGKISPAQLQRLIQVSRRRAQQLANR